MYCERRWKKSAKGNNLISIIEVPEGKSEEIKQKFNSHFIVYNNQQNYR
jgi:hypothetical protein